MVDLALDHAATPPSRWIAGLRRGGPRLWVGAALVAVLMLVALLAPLIAPHDPLEQDLMSAQLPPAWTSGGDPAYWAGTGRLGRWGFFGVGRPGRTPRAAALMRAT